MPREVDVLAVINDEILRRARSEGSGFRTLDDRMQEEIIRGGCH